MNSRTKPAQVALYTVGGDERSRHAQLSTSRGPFFPWFAGEYEGGGRLDVTNY
ncbi:MAG TPA: hypothetical protein VES39_12545 [Rhodospirillales bacterium]|nr:hypothetical protein [Rhodospirillales bacterium]